MPEIFQRRDENGDLRPVEFLSVLEIAEMFRCSESYVRKQLRLHRWPAFRIAGRYWFAPEHIEAIYAAQETETDQVVYSDPPRIGLLIDPEDEEGVR